MPLDFQTIHSEPSEINMSKIKRIMEKDYHLVNQNDTSEKVIVHRFDYEAGVTRFRPKNETEVWKRTFKIIDPLNVTRFAGAETLVLQHKSDEFPSMTDSDSNIWKIEEIPTETTAPASDGTTKRQGRPKGAKNKPKNTVKPITDAVEPTAEAETPADSAAITPVAEIAEPSSESTSIMADGSTVA